jgi:hypothetical protein
MHKPKTFRVEPFETNERFPELDEILERFPPLQTQRASQQDQAAARDRARLSAAPSSIVSAWPNENKVPCGEWLGSLAFSEFRENDHRKYERGHSLSPSREDTAIRRATKRGMRRLRTNKR